MKPTIDEIKSLYKGLKDQVYATMHSKMRECKKTYELDITVEVPEGFNTYIPPTAYYIVQVGAFQLITDTPTVEVEAVSESEKGQRNRDLTQRFLEHSLDRWVQMNDVSPLGECAKNMCLYGMACLKGPLYDATAWGSEPVRRTDEDEEDWLERLAAHEATKRARFPLIVRAIDPLTIYPDPSGRRRFNIEAYTRLAMDIKASWPEWAGYDASKPLKEVNWIEYWDEDWRCFLAEGDPVLKGGVQKNIYGFIPYDWAYSGWGKTSPDGKPEEKCIGLLNANLSAINAEARLKTALDAHLRLNVYGRYLVRPGANIDWRFHPGVAIEAEAADIGLMPQPVINRDTYAILSMLTRDIEAGAYSATLSGEAPVGVESGYHQAVLTGQARLRYRAPRRMLELITANQLEKHALILKRVIKQPIPIAPKVSIKPEQIDEPIVCRVTLEPQDPAENDRRTRLGIELAGSRLISRKTAREKYLKVSDVEERQQILIEEILELPQVRQALGSLAVEEWGLKELLAKATAVGGEAQQGPPAPAPMGVPPVPPPGGPPMTASGTPQELLMQRLQRLGVPGGEAALGSPVEEGEQLLWGQRGR